MKTFITNQAFTMLLLLGANYFGTTAAQDLEVVGQEAGHPSLRGLLSLDADCIHNDYYSTGPITDLYLSGGSKKNDYGDGVPDDMCYQTVELWKYKNKNGNDHARTVHVNDGADLNRGAGGHYIYLHYTRHPDAGKPITDVLLQQHGADCTVEYYNKVFQPVDRVDNLNGDLNQDAGGKDIFLCVQRKENAAILLEDIKMTNREPDGKSPDSNGKPRNPKTPDGLNGDLNQGAGGMDIFLDLTWEYY